MGTRSVGPPQNLERGITTKDKEGGVMTEIVWRE